MSATRCWKPPWPGILRPLASKRTRAPPHAIHTPPPSAALAPRTASAPQLPGARTSTTTLPVGLTPNVLAFRALASHRHTEPSAIAPIGNGIARWNAGPRRPMRVRRPVAVRAALPSRMLESAQPCGAWTRPSKASLASRGARSGPTERTFPAGPIRQSLRGPSRRPSVADVTTSATGAPSPIRDRSGRRIATGAGRSTDARTSPAESSPCSRCPARSAAQKATSPGPREPTRPRARASATVAAAPSAAPRSPRRVAEASVPVGSESPDAAPFQPCSIRGPHASDGGR